VKLSGEGGKFSWVNANLPQDYIPLIEPGNGVTLPRNQSKQKTKQVLITSSVESW